MTQLPDEVPQHPDFGQQWFEEGKCVGCGADTEQPGVYHCEECYARIFPSIFDYDDD